MKPPPIVQCTRAGAEGCDRERCDHFAPHEQQRSPYAGETCSTWAGCWQLGSKPVRCVRVKEGG